MMKDALPKDDLLIWIDSVRKKIDSIQSIENTRVTKFSHDPTGLGAQISRRVLALRFAMATGRRSTFQDEMMYPYVNCYEPLCANGVTKPLDLDEKSSFDFNDIDFDGDLIFDFWKFWDDEGLKSRIYSYIPDGIGNSHGAQLLFEGVLLSRMKLKDEFQGYVDDSARLIGIDGEYIGVHYRRGDKKVETPYVSTERYREAVIAVARSTGINKVFIASDSPSAVDELNLSIEGLQVYFDTSEIRLNNANHRYLMRNQDKALQETMTAIKNIYLLAGGAKIVGQTNAHFATIAASLISLRDATLDPGVLIPGDIQLSAPLTASRYKIKNAAKGFVKKIFPFLTIRSKGKKK